MPRRDEMNSSNFLKIERNRKIRPKKSHRMAYSSFSLRIRMRKMMRARKARLPNMDRIWMVWGLMSSMAKNQHVF